MRIIRFAFLLFVLALTIGGIRYIAQKYRSPLAATDPAPSPTAAPDSLPDFSLAVVQVGPAGRRLVTCGHQRCTTQSPPSAAEAVTDGAAWYYYEDGALKKTARDKSDSVLVTEQTPLVKPRRLFISPDSTKVAFWLDNIADPHEQLTELWVYDDTEGGTRLLAEKISQPDVLTSPRWNRSSTHLWFIGDTSKASEPSRPELLAVSLNPPSINSRFTQVDWQKQTALASSGAMDISHDGERLAYAEAKTHRTSTLSVIGPDGQPAATTVRGRILYIQWLEDQSLLYATQDEEGVTFWRVRGTLHHHIVHQAGQLLSVNAGRQGRYISFAVQVGRQVGLYTADTASGRLAAQQTIPQYGTDTFIVSAKATPREPIAARAVNQLEDAVLASVIEHHLPDIARLPVARPQRLIITERPNTLYVDYADAAGQAQRLLLTVYDPAQPAWSINARYRDASGEWVKTQGGGLSDPKPLRLYEWESARNQWILKEEYSPPLLKKPQ